MKIPSHFILLLLIVLFILHFSPFISGQQTNTSSTSSTDLVNTSCTNASYPNICIKTLSSYNTSIITPKDLAEAAVNISLSRSKKTCNFLIKLKAHSKREARAVSDCIEEIGDSIEDLRKSLSGLKELHEGYGFEFQMSNLETWVSAALTNEDTCLDGFREIGGRVRHDVKRKISNVAKVTSNALYLINLLDDSHEADSGFKFDGLNL